MHGLIFVTWERFLAEEYGTPLLERYRAAIGETSTTTPLTSRTYDDAALLKGVGAAATLTQTPADSLLYGYGRYFLLNGLTSRLCNYLLGQVCDGRSLLLAMRAAHKQMGSATPGVTPPLFTYQALSDDPNGLILLYDSPRQLCPLLLGAIEGAAERYHQEVRVYERACMRRGAPACRFEIHFEPPQAALSPQGGKTEQRQRFNDQLELASLLYAVLPDEDGVTLAEVGTLLRRRRVSARKLRPFLLLEALSRLHHAGWVATTADQPGDTLENRRYWRVQRAF
jgi:hypothetical protein